MTQRGGMYVFITLLWVALLEATSKGRSTVENLQECEECFGFGQAVKRQDVSRFFLHAEDFLSQ